MEATTTTTTDDVIPPLVTGSVSIPDIVFTDSELRDIADAKLVYKARVHIIDAIYALEKSTAQTIYGHNQIALWFNSKLLRLSIEEVDLGSDATEDDFLAAIA